MIVTDEQNEQEDDTVKVFVSDNSGPANYVCFFEDDGETGYLYVSDRSARKVVKHLQLYANAQELNVREEDVRVGWASDGLKCGVVIWSGLRGVIDLENGDVAAFITSRNTPPLKDPGRCAWLRRGESGRRGASLVGGVGLGR